MDGAAARQGGGLALRGRRWRGPAVRRRMRGRTQARQRPAPEAGEPRQVCSAAPGAESGAPGLASEVLIGGVDLVDRRCGRGRRSARAHFRFAAIVPASRRSSDWAPAIWLMSRGRARRSPNARIREFGRTCGGMAPSGRKGLSGASDLIRRRRAPRAAGPAAGPYASRAGAMLDRLVRPPLTMTRMRRAGAEIMGKQWHCFAVNDPCNRDG